MKRMIVLLLIFFTVVFTAPVFGVNGDEEGFNFSMDMTIGAATFNEGDPTEAVSYQELSLKPDFSFGKIGIGLDLSFHYRFYNGIDFRKADWVPGYDENDLTFWDIYLPIFRYVRYGHKGESIYAKVGLIDDGTLGNGFLMGGYSNTNYLPERRIVGLAFDLDGSLFNFPYLGIETFTGNLAKFDVFGTRLYSRPLSGMDIPIIKNLQIGATVALDNKPNAFGVFESGITPEKVSMYGVDFKQPVLNSSVLSLALFGDFDVQSKAGNKTEPSTGGLLGFGGRLIGFIDYGLNALFLGGNFVPFYFDSTYDLDRESKYNVYSGETDLPGYTGWLASLGFSFLDDKLVFKTSLDGSFSKPNPDNIYTYPHLKASFLLGEDIIPGIYFDASYDKRKIVEFKDIVDFEHNTVIGANIHYKTGPAVITLGYNLRFVRNLETGELEPETTSSLSTSISLF